MANVVQLPHPLDEGDGSVESGATAPDNAVGEAVDDAVVNVIHVNFAHTLIKSNLVMKAKQKGQKRYVLFEEAMQEDTQCIADYVEQVCNLP
jgi:hypothetical protein